GEVLAKEGDVTVANAGEKLTISGNISDEKGNVEITNNGAEGTEISSEVLAKEGSITISNTSGALNLTADSKIKDEKGNVSVTNTATDKGTTLAGEVLAKEGDVTVANAGEKLTISGNISDEKGNVEITNNGAKGAEISGEVLAKEGSITVSNTSGALTISGGISDKFGNIEVTNNGAGVLELTENGVISAVSGDVTLSNSNDGGMEISGNVGTQKGDIVLTNTSADGAVITTSGKISDTEGNITLNNNGTDGLKVEGKVLAEKGNITVNNRDSDLTVGELASANDNYIMTHNGNVNINQINGNILNGVVDINGGKHQNEDKGNPQQSYKTLIAAGGDLIIDAKDGNIGFSQLENPASSIEASTRDWTDSINVNVGGTVTAIAANENKSDTRLINLRAKDSDLNIKNVTADGDVLLTAADWKQADVRPTPDDADYFEGYSISNKAEKGKAAVIGRNISIIASDNIGESGNKFAYMQDTAAAPKSSVSFEAENDLFVSGDSNSDNDMIIHQMISKRGNSEVELKHNTAIGKITSGKGLKITQQAQNLTVYEIGGGSSQEQEAAFDDILYSHDGLIYGNPADDGSNYVIPQYVNIQVLDAIDNPECGDSNLKIYSLNVKGNNGKNDNYYPDGGRLADVTLMADNIYANSDKAPSSSVSTKDYPEGYKQTQTTYTASQFGGNDDTTVYAARGINAYGKGTPLSLDIIGVDKDVVDATVENANRTVYKEQTSVTNAPETFKNSQDSIYDYDFRAKNAVISVNDYTDGERGIEFDTLYADNAYINTLDTNLSVHDGYINNYAEFRNGDRAADINRYLVVVDNDYRCLVPSDVQLYTQKTGSFDLSMNEKIKTHTVAPVVHYDWYKLINTFSDENSFVRLGLKETELRQTAKDYYRYSNVYIMPEASVARYEVWRDSGLFSNVKIMEMDRNSAVIVNRENWQVGEEKELELMFDDVKTKIHCKVISIDRNYATVLFTDMSDGVYNKLAYRYLKMANR
ncbi:MAG: hypothetical protein IJS88_03300, partial [Alphaproteobacteria bacterium]|nr:hypothetical protein [Alphaproteobacteria bacterium]